LLSPADVKPWSSTDASSLEKLESNPVAMVLSKLEQVLRRAQAAEEENRLLKAELSSMRERQDRLDAKLEEVAHQHDQRTQGLESENADLDGRINSLEERQAELEERQDKTEDKCDTIEVNIADHVHSAVRDRLIGALETM
jgi:chromosome segregation ATPase